HLIGRIRLKHRERLFRLHLAAVQPIGVGFRRQDDRLTGMELGDKLVRLASEDRTALKLITIRTVPDFPQASEGENGITFKVNVERIFTFLRPLVEAIGGYQAAAALEGILKGRFLCDSFGTGVEYLAADSDIVGPRGDQAPAVICELARLGISDNGNWLGRRDVIARRGLDRHSIKAERLQQGIGIGSQDKTSTHSAPTSSGAVCPIQRSGATYRRAM